VIQVQGDPPAVLVSQDERRPQPDRGVLVLEDDVPGRSRKNVNVVKPLDM
jgi:hypothetical protein